MSLKDQLRDHDTIRNVKRFSKEKLPRWVVPAIITLAVISWIPLVLIARERVATGPTTKVQIFVDMDNQPRFQPQMTNPLYEDQRAMRKHVAGTVARGELQRDELLYRGEVDGKSATAFPFELTDEIMQRGQSQYNIFCAPCHGLSGYGDGMIAQRAEELQEGSWIPPLSFHSQTVRDRTNGSLFNTITNGIRTMPAYGSQIPVRDRWAIVAYIRALQRSQHATPDDVPPEHQSKLR